MNIGNLLEIDGGVGGEALNKCCDRHIMRMKGTVFINFFTNLYIITPCRYHAQVNFDFRTENVDSYTPEL